MIDIIERLRIESRREPHEPIWRDAIDEIEALRAEVERLKNYVLQIERYVLRNVPPEIGFLKDDTQRVGEGEQQ